MTRLHSAALALANQAGASGRMMLRLPSQLHAHVSVAAERTGMSVNQWAATALEQASHV